MRRAKRFDASSFHEMAKSRVIIRVTKSDWGLNGTKQVKVSILTIPRETSYIVEIFYAGRVRPSWCGNEHAVLRTYTGDPFDAIFRSATLDWGLGLMRGWLLNDQVSVFQVFGGSNSPERLVGLDPEVVNILTMIGVGMVDKCTVDCQPVVARSVKERLNAVVEEYWSRVGSIGVFS